MIIEPSPVLPESIADRLRASIIAQQDAPGSTITESAVALRFGVARPTARIAIERLVADGLLRREVHRAARVPELSRDDIVDLYNNRAIVESAAIAALGSIPAAALDAHRSILASNRSTATRISEFSVMRAPWVFLARFSRRACTVSWFCWSSRSRVSLRT